jgi:dUTP pyrophosphatase
MPTSAPATSPGGQAHQGSPRRSSPGGGAGRAGAADGREDVTNPRVIWPIVLEVDLVRLDPGLPVPARAHPDDAGLDLHCATDVEIAPGERALVGTGVSVALPTGYAAFVCPRSGLAAREGLGLLNAPGTVDAGYRGEIRVCLVNHDPARTVVLHRGDRVAQLVIQRVELPTVRVVDELPTSQRGDGGFGSSGGWSRMGDLGGSRSRNGHGQGIEEPVDTGGSQDDDGRGRPVAEEL